MRSLDQRIEGLKAALAAAEWVGMATRNARGPWAERNRKANSKRQARLRRELRQAYEDQFREKLRQALDTGNIEAPK